MFHQCCGIPQEKRTGRLLETSLSKSLNSCACNSQRQIGHTGLSCGGRREQVSIEDGYVVGSVYTIIESFKIFLGHLKSDGLLISYVNHRNQNSLDVQSQSLYRQIVLIAQWSS